MTDIDRIGLIGLGKMGSRMAAVLTEHGRSLNVYDIDPAARERVSTDRVTANGNVADVARAAEVVLLSLPGPEAVAEVVSPASGLLGGEGRVRLVVDLSTIDPATARKLAEVAAAHGVEYVDSPVLGRPDACGNWTLPMGGSQAAVDLAAQAVGPVAARMVHVGDVGTASLVKLLNNLMFGAINAVTAEIMVACRAAGLEPEVFLNVLADSGAASVSKLFLELGPKIVARDYTPNFTVDLLHKDNELAVSVLEDLGIPTVIGSAVELVNRMGVSTGLGSMDTSALVHVYEHYLADEKGKL